eukprot:CAMPEP_0172493336 /NCGR_PEP_ID=MMETSP1066-20121228/24733_1 /TAXON_ID=671091 /ORGANISM="Coscinodiscus wailesii, Strain CCMP2513" /LENGTH=1154 /DNA_ID=CAMNT_0013263443 /DNA_START=206 /DNA_END=3670 /DNA_ORIENTATION=-
MASGGIIKHLLLCLLILHNPKSAISQKGTSGVSNNKNIFFGAPVRQFNFEITTRLHPFTAPSSSHESNDNNYIRIIEINNDALATPRDYDDKGHGIFSGPPMHVVEGDVISVTLTNSLPQSGLSLHWHGFEMADALVYDGVVGVTQCPVFEGDSFVYSFLVEEEPGTYWYHTHSGLMKEGFNAVRGPLIVHPLNDADLVDALNGVVSSVTDDDEDGTEDDSLSITSPVSYRNERILFFSDGFRETSWDTMWVVMGGLNPSVSKNEDGFTIGTHPWEFGTCNGKFNEEVKVWSGERYKFRIINGGHVFALRVSIFGLRMRVVAADSSPVPEELVVDDVIVHTAERFDVLVDIPEDAVGGDYWIRAETLESRRQGYRHGMKVKLTVQDLVSEDDESDDMVKKEDNMTISEIEGEANDRLEHYENAVSSKVTINCYSAYESSLSPDACLPLTALSSDPTAPPSQEQPSVLSPLSLALSELYEVHTVDFRFQPPPQYSHFVRLDDGYNIQHVTPRKAMLLGSGEGAGSQSLHPHAAVLHVGSNKGLILIWRSETSMDHPIHLHGYKMEILKVITPNRSTDCTIVKCRLNTSILPTTDDKTISQLLQSSSSFVKKDTFIIPAGGTVITRVSHTGPPALWFAHCHMDIHREDGMAFILNVGNYTSYSSSERENKKLPSDYPSCDAPQLFMERTLPACDCYDNRDSVLGLRMVQGEYKCSREHLCRHAVTSSTSAVERYNYEGGIATHGSYAYIWVIPTVVTICVFVISAVLTAYSKYYPARPLPNDVDAATSVVTLFKSEWKKYRPESINRLRIAEVAGLGLLTGFVFHEVGSDNSNRGLRESISLLFFSMTLWTFTRMYPAVSSYHSWKKRVLNARRNDNDNEKGTTPALAKLLTQCLIRAAVVTIAEAAWPLLYCAICFPIAQIAFSLANFFTIACLLSLNALCYIGMGGVMGVMMPSIPLGMITCTIFAQTSLICAGFYTTLPNFLHIVRFLSPVYHTFSGMLKSSYKWSDTFECLIGDSDVGVNKCFLERSGSIEDLKSRGINVATFGDADSQSIFWEIIFLFFYYVVAQFLIFALKAIQLAGERRRLRACIYQSLMMPRNVNEVIHEEEQEESLELNVNVADNQDQDNDDDDNERIIQRLHFHEDNGSVDHGNIA